VSSPLISNPHHVLQENLLTATVVELRCPALGVAGDPLCHFQRSSVLQKIDDACRSKRNGERMHPTTRRLRAAFEHSAASIRVAGRFPSFRVLPTAIGKKGVVGRLVRPDISKYWSRSRFYAGAPLISPAGHALGMLSVSGPVPRTLDSRQSASLQALSRQAVAQMELRNTRRSWRGAWKLWRWLETRL
jgi:hypothetical protein